MLMETTLRTRRNVPREFEGMISQDGNAPWRSECLIILAFLSTIYWCDPFWGAVILKFSDFFVH